MNDDDVESSSSVVFEWVIMREGVLNEKRPLTGGDNIPATTPPLTTTSFATSYEK